MKPRPTQRDAAPRPPRARSEDPTPGRWSSGWAVFCTVVLLGAVGAIIYARESAAEVTFRLLTDGGLVLLWLAAAAGWGAWPTARLTKGLAPSVGTTGEGVEGRPTEPGAGRHADQASGGTLVGPAVPADGPGSAGRSSHPGPAAGTAGPTNASDQSAHPPAGPALLLTTAAAVGLGTMSLLILGLGLAGLLCRTSSAALLAAGLALGGAWLYRSRLALFARRAPGVVRESPAWDWLWLAAVPLLAAALVAAFVPPGLLWKPEEPHGYDAVEYHLQVPREWHEAGRIAPTPHNVFGYFPFGVEMHYLLAMHVRGGAWAGMYLAQLMHVAMVALSAVAAYGVASRLAGDRRFAVVASVAGATVPWLAQLAPIAFNEGGLLLYGTLTIGWALVLAGSKDEGGRMKDEAARAGVGPSSDSSSILPPSSLRVPHPSSLLPASAFVLPGLLAGFACGVKLTAVPLLLVAVPVVLLLVLFRRSRRLAMVGPLVFVLAGMAAFSPWLLRNLAWTGNPVFPEGRTVFGSAHFSREQAERWRRAHAPQAGQASAATRSAAFVGQAYWNWQFGYVLLPLAGAGLVVTVLARSRALRSPLSDPSSPTEFADRPGLNEDARSPRLAAGPQVRPGNAGNDSAPDPTTCPDPWFLGGLLLIHLLFWLGFTHLQGRFFVLAIPIAVMVLASTPWDRLGGRPAVRAASATLAAATVLAAGAGWWNVHRRLAFKLYEDQGTGVVVALGNTEIDWITAGTIEGFPANDPAARLLLVGDAQAFWYPLPAGRLTYRTVFDLDTAAGRPLLDVFDPKGTRHDGRTWLLVDPGELERYARTYQPFPEIPEAWRRTPQWQARLPFLVRPGAAVGR